MRKITKFRVCVCVVLGIVCAFQTGRAYGSENAPLWWNLWRGVAGGSLLLSIGTVEDKTGMTGTRGYDDLLALETAVYRIGGDDSRRGMYRGAVYIEDGLAVGFATHYRSTSRGMLTRFKLAHFDELLLDSDLSAIAADGERCDVYHVFTVGGEGNVCYLLDGETYRKMEKLGFVPSLPPSHGRVGLAA